MNSFNFTTFPSLKTERLLLRKSSLEYTKDVFNIRSSKEINKFVGTKRVENHQQVEDFIEVCDRLYHKKNRIFWLIEYQKEIIGSIVLHKISLNDNYAEIGYKLKPAFQQKGFMTEAMQSVINFGFLEMNLKRIEAYTHKDNMASITLLKKHNFVYQPERKCTTFDFNRIFKLDII